jgi:hypothetical protein
MCRRSPAIAGAVVRLPESSSISPSVRDALAVIHRQALELIVEGASLETVLDALCDGIDALDPDLISSVLLADPDGQRLWPKAGRTRARCDPEGRACRSEVRGSSERIASRVTGLAAKKK